MAVYNGGGLCYVTVFHDFNYCFVHTVKCVHGEVFGYGVRNMIIV